MHTSLFTTVLLAIIVGAGCTRSGDFGTFLVAEVTKYGGHFETNAPLPKLEARWTVKRNDNGFNAIVSGVPFSVVDAFMHQACGKSNVFTMRGRPYGEANIGVALHWFGYPDRTEIDCLRGQPVPFNGTR
jgi:hypothetical protein